MVKGTVTGMVLKDVPDDIPKMDSCPSCTLTKLRHFPYFVLMDDYSRASWVLLLRAKSDAPVKFEKWVKMMENGTDKSVRTVMFDNAKELTAGRMREFCDKHSIRIITSVPYSPSSNGVAE